MDSRERILNTLGRKPCDRIPVSASYLVTEYHEFFPNQEPSYAALMQVIAGKADTLYPCWFQPVMDPEADARRESVTRGEGGSQFTDTVIHAPAGDLTSRYRADDGVVTGWTTEHLLKDVEDIDTYLSIPDEVVGVGVEAIGAAVERLEHRRGIPWVQLGDPAGAAAGLFEFGQFLVLCLTERERIRHLLDAIFERQMRQLRLGLDAMDPLGETCLFTISGPEYLTAPYLPEEYLREFVRPYIAPMIEEVHRHGHYASVHCHGRSSAALKYFVEAGADAVDPLEPPPDGDTVLSDVKKRFGDDLVLIGNIEISLLDLADTSAVVEYVQDMVTVGKQGGGYIAMPTSFPIDIPLRPQTERNWIAYIETALEYGRF